MKNKNEQGFVLIAALAFFLIFTLLGMASIYSAGVQNEWTEKLKFSNQAFWLAEAGIELSRSNLPGVLLTNSNIPVVINSAYFGNYAVATQRFVQGNYTFQNKWIANTTGNVKNQLTNIEAIMSNYAIEDAIVTKGPLRGFNTCNNGQWQGNAKVGTDLNSDGDINDTVNGTLEASCDFASQNVPFTFSQIFNGVTINEVKNMATQTITTIPSTIHSSGITVIYTNKNNENFNLDGTGFVIVEVPANKKVTITHAGFAGILWITGGGQVDVDISGQPNFRGSIFVDSTAETKITGTGDYLFDPVAIDQAVSQFGNIYTNSNPVIISWREL